MGARFKCGRLDWAKCGQLLGMKPAKQIGHNTILERFFDEDGVSAYAVRYWSTRILRFYRDRTVLHSGGHRTSTTKARLALLGPVHVYQHKGEWFLHSAPGVGPVPFVDGMTIYHKGPETTEEALARAAREGDPVAAAALADYRAETA